MKSSLYVFALTALTLLACSFSVEAEDFDCCTEDGYEMCCDEQLFRHQFFIGPEIYYNRRSAEGAHEDGVIYGVRAGYDYIRRYAFYFGIEGLYSRGCLEGENQLKDKIKSDFSNSMIEGRIGYNFETKSCWHLCLIPFIGGGYCWETNNFKHPTPLHVHFKNTFYYACAGFLSRVFLSPHFSLGVNFKVRYPIEGKIHVSNDPKFNNFDLRYEEKCQYRVDVPLTYYFCWCRYDLGVSLVPFYEYRHYGRRAGYKADFPATKFNFYGADLRLVYVF